MPHSGRTFDKGGFLASLLFLKQEASRDGYDRTAKAVEQAIEIFFEDMGNTGQLDQNVVMMRAVLQKAMFLSEANLLKFINLVQSLDSDSNNFNLH